MQKIGIRYNKQKTTGAFIELVSIHDRKVQQKKKTDIERVSVIVSQTYISVLIAAPKTTKLLTKKLN